MICYVEHVSDTFCVFFTLFGCGGGGPKGAGAQPAGAVLQPRQLKNGNFSNRFFFDILTIQKYQISYVKDVLAPLYVVFTLFGCWGWGGGGGGGLPSGLGHNLLMQFSSLGSSNMDLGNWFF